jgi:hypothetical protein
MITLELTLEEINLILGALGQRPYSEVSALIAKVYKIGQEAVNVEEASV